MVSTSTQTQPPPITVNRQLCCYCGACVAVCQENAMFLQDVYLHIDADTCTACRRCMRVCPVHALSITASTTAPTTAISNEVSL